ncbi:hypothetical protein H311_01087 [Anncaliia algerae PRA109]|nr:hypothetical protein H311_01087 [Anncaliia algerae PRA109]
MRNRTEQDIFIIFTNIESSLKFLLDINIINIGKISAKCGGVTKNKIYKQNEKKKNFKQSSMEGCQTKTSLIDSKLSLNDFLFLIYVILISLIYYQIVSFILVSAEKITKAKKSSGNAFKKYSGDKFMP